MRLTKKICSVMISGLITSLLVSSAFSDETCKECAKKELEGSPSVHLKAFDSITKIAATEIGFDNYLETYCMKYTKITFNELGQMIRDLKDTNYPVDDYFMKAGCTPQAVGGVKTPMIQLTGEAPCSRGEFPQRIFKYYNEKIKKPELWLKVVNSLNTNGETYLDFLDTLETHGNFNTDETRECAKKLISYACQTGGVYLKATNRSCPTGL